jgi:mismatch-specific thymine-DNA glycosylase
MNYQTTIKISGEEFKTLEDIIPKNGKVKILFIAKTPALKSVDKGHYFQGRQGKMFWNKLVNSGLLKIEPNTFEDENLLNHNYGITDIVKKPRNFGNEPSDDEYQNGYKRIEKIIKEHDTDVIVFVYKKVLDKILKIAHGINDKSDYGLNKNLKNLFGTNVFVFPMPGTPCTKEKADKAMNDLKKIIQSPVANNGFHK